MYVKEDSSRFILKSRKYNIENGYWAADTLHAR